MTKAEHNLPRGLLPSLHLAYWLMYAAVLAVIFGVAASRAGKPYFGATASAFLISVVPAIVAFYGSYFVLFDRFLRRRRFLQLAAAGVLTGVVAAIAALLTAAALFGQNQPAFHELKEGATLGLSLFLLSAAHIACALVIRGFIEWFEAAAATAELKSRNLEAELALVRAQLDPHFLFNTLNNIDVLIERDPPVASQYLNELAGLLRFMVYDAPTETIALELEIENIRRYVDLQLVRGSDQGRVSVVVDGNVAGRRIAPMLIFPFVENAFKHGPRNGEISIAISVSVDGVGFVCRNRLRHDEPSEPRGGRGNQLVRRRLELLYPSRHRLETMVDDDSYELRLMIYEN